LLFRPPLRRTVDNSLNPSLMIWLSDSNNTRDESRACSSSSKSESRIRSSRSPADTRRRLPPLRSAHDGASLGFGKLMCLHVLSSFQRTETFEPATGPHSLQTAQPSLGEPSNCMTGFLSCQPPGIPGCAGPRRAV
jgi:hypothetical protein